MQNVFTLIVSGTRNDISREEVQEKIQFLLQNKVQEGLRIRILTEVFSTAGQYAANYAAKHHYMLALIPDLVRPKNAKELYDQLFSLAEGRGETACVFFSDVRDRRAAMLFSARANMSGIPYRSC